jgi:hypothetical protein
MADTKIDADQPMSSLNEESAQNSRRPWQAPMVLLSTVSRQTNKGADYLPEGHQGSTVDIS